MAVEEAERAVGLFKSEDITISKAQGLPDVPPIVESFGKPTPPGVVVRASFRVANFKNYDPLHVPYLVAAVRDSNGRNVDFPGVEITLPPPQGEGWVYLYSHTRTFPPGNYTVWPAYLAKDTGDWVPLSAPFRFTVKLPGTVEVYPGWPVRVEELTLRTSGGNVVAHLASVAPGELTASFTVQNKSPWPLKVPYLVAAARDYSNGRNVDFPGVEITLQPGESFRYSQRRTFPAGGYSVWASYLDADIGRWGDLRTGSGPGWSHFTIASPKEVMPPPPSKGIKQVAFWNCHGDRRTVHIWVLDLTTGARSEKGTLPAQWVGPSCGPATGARPLAVDMAHGHLHQIVVVDPGALNCNGRNDPTILSCQKGLLGSPSPLPGDQNGVVVPWTIS